ncbi:MAG: SufE family protein [Porphyromonas sp.]|nr:SufE family protein [Porphyromonas sp.]
MTINQIQDQIVEEFTELEDWMDRYALLIELGGEVPPLEDSEKKNEHLIEGCQSRVWIVCNEQDGVMQLKADSDALITKGIAALMLRVFDQQPPCEVAKADLYFIEQIGFKEHLSPTRSNGLMSMVATIKQKATLMCATQKV